MMPPEQAFGEAQLSIEKARGEAWIRAPGHRKGNGDRKMTEFCHFSVGFLSRKLVLRKKNHENQGARWARESLRRGVDPSPDPG
eukprot:6498289-Pyramimonas_sp.AAC.1